MENTRVRAHTHAHNDKYLVFSRGISEIRKTHFVT